MHNAIEIVGCESMLFYRLFELMSRESIQTDNPTKKFFHKSMFISAESLLIYRTSTLIYITIELFFYCFPLFWHETRIKIYNPLNLFTLSFLNYIP